MTLSPEFRLFSATFRSAVGSPLKSALRKSFVSGIAIWNSVSRCRASLRSFAFISSKWPPNFRSEEIKCRLSHQPHLKLLKPADCIIFGSNGTLKGFNNIAAFVPKNFYPNRYVDQDHSLSFLSFLWSKFL